MKKYSFRDAIHYVSTIYLNKSFQDFMQIIRSFIVYLQPLIRILKKNDHSGNFIPGNRFIYTN